MPADASLLLLLLILGAVSLLVGLQVWQIIRSRRPGSRSAPENEYHVTAPVLELRRSPGRIPEEYWRWDSLTLREREIVRLAVVGKQNSEIAVEVRPAARLDGDRCAQVDVVGLEAFRTD